MIARPESVPLRPDRVLFPQSGFAKSDAIRYYKRIAKVFLPHLKNRPVSFKRYVDTIDGESFWEKDAPSFTPSWVKRVAVPRRGEGEDDIEYIVINDVKTLTWIADVGGIEIHPFLHTAPRLDLATQIVFDLDPGEGADIRDCAHVSLLLREALAAMQLESFAKVSGSKGIQVHVPIAGAPHETTESFARVLADELARRHPTLIVSKMAKPLRANKVFIDWNQNADYKTTIGVYSLRAKSETPYVSMPVRWEELEKPRKKALYFEPDEAVARVNKIGDLFAPLLKRSRGALPKRPEGRRALIPKPSTQSGRRLFVLTAAELWLDTGGQFKRWLIHGDRVTPAGELPIDKAFYRGEVPPSLKVEDMGAYEIVEGSEPHGRFDLWFNGRALSGEWILEKTGGGETWRLAPATTPSSGG